MKLINSLFYLINETKLDVDKTLPLITIFQIDNNLIRLYSTIHQSKERHGSETLKQIRKRYHDNELRNPVNFDRVGVPNHIIKDIFEKDFEQIKKAFEFLSTKNNDKVLIVKNIGEEYDLDENMKYVEILIASSDLKKYTIITSLFSKDGDMFKTFNYNKKSPRFKLR
jgi:cell fate regulator YaaT (PSP1 superfamily)